MLSYIYFFVLFIFNFLKIYNTYSISKSLLPSASAFMKSIAVSALNGSMRDILE